MFEDVKFFISGEVPDSVRQTLLEGGGLEVRYFSDYVSHCIVGQGAAECDVTEARELYEVPAVRGDWVLLSADCGRLLPTAGFLVGDDRVFSGVVACLSGVGWRDRRRLWAMVAYHGGRLDPALRSSCTHLIAAQPSGAKYERAAKCPGIQVVSPDWVLDSLRAGRRCDEGAYHPRLLLPARPESPGNSITRSFSEATNEFCPDSETRAVLEKLKMCFPWNKPESPSLLDGVCPLPQAEQAQDTVTSPLASPLPRRCETQVRLTCGLAAPNARSPPAPGRDGARAVECTVSDALCRLCNPADGREAAAGGRGREGQAAEGSVPFVSLLVRRVPGVRTQPSTPDGVSGGRLRQTASIAARRLAAFNKDARSADGQVSLPPQRCLYGSVFCILGYEEVSSKGPCLKYIIGKYGGAVESSYGPSVTHVLCASLDDPTAQQAAKDGKRCITAYWLNDVLQKKKILPPWQAIHLPVTFSKEKPCKDLRISLSQFENEERIRVQLMVEKIGATFTQSFSKENDLLVCKRASGYKYTKACDWAIPVVNVRWLNDVYLSDPPCALDPRQTKYQDFDDSHSQQPQLDSRLMASWEEGVQTDRLAERNTSVSSGAKRPREGEACSQAQSKKLRSDADPRVQHKNLKVVFSLANDKENLEQKVLELGGDVVADIKDATHLVMGTKNLSTKFFCALSLVQFILSDKWVEDSYAAKRFVGEKPYILDVSWKGVSKLSLSSLLKKPNRTKLFKGKTFFVTPGTTPKSSTLRAVIEAAGGTVEDQWRTLESLREAKLDSSNYFVVCGSSDRRSISHISDNGFVVLCPSALMIAILKQEVPKA
ncbi:PAX-interacting protein 1-like [Bacillus rossius redtenbacheri]|uniref:PAX-interacting protein 1-like n=1 Tax=Bacillus rossius redtenbacheri TaxID=93214 RepID=UPI002FDEA4A9